jgi:hypothetical protein
VAISIALGCVLSSFRQNDAAFAAPQPADDANAEVVAQLKDATAELKSINAFLRSGKLRVLSVINTDVGE